MICTCLYVCMPVYKVWLKYDWLDESVIKQDKKHVIEPYFHVIIQLLFSDEIIFLYQYTKFFVGIWRFCVISHP